MIAFVEKDRVVIAYSPNCALNGYREFALSQEDLFLESNLLIWKMKGFKNCLMCGWEQLRECDLFRYGKPLIKGGEITVKRLVGEFRPAMLKRAEEEGFVSEDEKLENNYMIAQNNRLYLLVGDLVHEVEDWATIGIYDREAICVLLEEYKDLPLDEKLRKISEYTEATEGSVMFPLLVMDTKTQEVRVLER